MARRARRHSWQSVSLREWLSRNPGWARDQARSRGRSGAASHGRALPGVQHGARSSHARAAGCRRVLGRAHRRAAQCRHHRARRADVQLQRAVDAADVFRPHCAGRGHLPLHQRRPGRSAHRDVSAYVFVTRGGVYGAAPTRRCRIRQFLGFIGIESEFVFAEGLGLGEESRRKSLGEARFADRRLTAVDLAA